MGDVSQTLLRCNTMIEERIGKILKLSPVVESEPWGFSAEQNFFNQALTISTQLSAEQVLKITQQIEIELGRQSKSVQVEGRPTYSSRPIDIDILFYNDDIIRTRELTIPHPLIQERDFVLTPLCQIEGERIHPVLKRTMNELKIAIT